MIYDFRWNDWNLEHIAEHGVHYEEAEYVVRGARWPYPTRAREGKYIVLGQTEAGEYLQVIYVFDAPGFIYVIHVRPLNEIEKRRLRRRRR